MISPPVAKKNQCGIVHVNNHWQLCDHEPPTTYLLEMRCTADSVHSLQRVR